MVDAGVGDRSRTYGLLITKQLLYHLRYASIYPTGIAPEPRPWSGFYGFPDMLVKENMKNAPAPSGEKVVQAGRVELPRHFCHEPLKLARLPIPPRLQIRYKKTGPEGVPLRPVFVSLHFSDVFTAFQCVLLLFTAFFQISPE